MGTATSLILIAIGAILAFAVNVTTSGIDLQVVGWILMAVGLLGLVLSIALWERLTGGPTPPPRRGRPPDDVPTRRF